MIDFRKVDLVCLGFMVIIVLIASGYWAIFFGWILVSGTPVWVGWIWWVVFTFVIVALLTIYWTLRRERS